MIKKILLLVLLAGGGYWGYDYYRGGFASAPSITQNDFLLSFKNGFRGVMVGYGSKEPDRRYLGYPADDVPQWYQKTWSICRQPTVPELESFEVHAETGPGSRLDAVCEIDADGDLFVRGWIVTVPKL